MGSSIKNSEVESLIRQYSQAQGLGVTDAVAKAVRIAFDVQRVERSWTVRQQAIAQLLNIADRG